MIHVKPAYVGPRALHDELMLVADGFRRVSSLAEAFYLNASTHADLIAYDQAQREPHENGAPRPLMAVTNGQSAERVLRMAACLESLGAKRGDAIGVLSFDRPEWNEAEMAVHTVGGIVVAAYVRDSIDRLHYILCDAGCKILFVENQEQLDKVRHILRRDYLAAGEMCEKELLLQGIICFEKLEAIENPNIIPFTRDPLAERMARWPLNSRSEPPLVCWQDALDQFPLRSPDTFEYIRTQRDEFACLFYTSGSKGSPKGVAVTHAQVLENLRQMVVAGLVDPERLLSSLTAEEQPSVTCLLPERAHVFPARVAQLAAVTKLRLRFPATVDHEHSQITPEYRVSVRRDLREHGCGIVLAVPKMLIAIQQLVRSRLEEMGWVGGLLCRTIERVARERMAESAGVYNAWDEVLKRFLGPLRRRVAKRIRDQIVGPEFEFFISGGAKLPLDTAAYLWAIGLPVYEGYGSTETNCPIAVNTPLAHRLGSVGKMFDGVETRVDPETHELWVRGQNIAQGYWNLPIETAAAFTADGWYRTGDAVHIDDDGFLYIEDRVDQLLVLLNGEKVGAVAVENRFANIPYVESAIVIGHARDALVALVVPNEVAIRRWAEKAGITFDDHWQRHPALLEMLREEIQRKVNMRAPHLYEHVRHVALIAPPDVAGQTLTATEKIKRLKLEHLHAELITQLYADRDHWLPIAS